MDYQLDIQNGFFGMVLSNWIPAANEVSVSKTAKCNTEMNPSTHVCFFFVLYLSQHW